MGLLFRLVCLSVLAAVAKPPHPAKALLKTGDVVLQTSKSSRSELIRRATASPYSHVGVVEVTAEGAFVIEAIEPVSRTPFEQWRQRGVSGKVRVLRSTLQTEQLAAVVTTAKSWLGTKYDARFTWGDDRLYCSELVTKAFGRAANVELGVQERVDSLKLSKAELLQAAAAGIRGDQSLVSPASIAADDDLQLVYSDFESSGSKR